MNRKRLRTGAGNSFTTGRVAHLRSRLGIASIQPVEITFDDGPEWRSVDQAATELGVSSDTIRRWARGGFLEARQVMPQAAWRVRITEDVRQRIVPEAPRGWVRLVDAAKRLGRSKHGPSGKREESTEWFRINVAGRQAEYAAHLQKGQRVLAIGRLQISHFQRKDGEQGTGFDVWADEIQNVTGRPATEGEDGRVAVSAAVGDFADEPLDDSLPF